MAEILLIGEFGRPAGGIERYMAQMAQLLRAHGDTVTAATPDGEFAPDYALNFDRTAALDDALNSRFDHAVIHKLRRHAFLQKLRDRFDCTMMIHDHELYCPRRSYYLPFSRKNCRRRYSRLACSLCATCRRPNSVDEIKHIWTTYAEFERSVMAFPRLAVVSTFMRQCLLNQGVPAENILLIPPAQKLIPDTVPNPAPRRLLYLGQLIRGKGVDQLIAALDLVEHDCELDIAGSGNDEAHLRKLAAGSRHKVNFRGFSAEPEAVLKQADIVILPHRWQEPFGLVGLEALAAGKAVVGFAVGGVSDYLHDGETGLAVPPGDVPELARAIDRLLADAPLIHRLGAAGRELVGRDFSEANFVRNWQKLWRTGR